SKAVSSPNLVGSDDASSAKRLAVSFIGANADGAAANEVATGAAAGDAVRVADGVAEVAAATAAPASTTVAAVARLSAPARPAPAGSFVAASVVREVTDAVLAQLAGADLTVRPAVLRTGLAPEAAIAVLEATARHSELVTALVVRNAVLESKVALCQPAAAPFTAPSAGGAATRAVSGIGPMAAPRSVPAAKKPVEMWSAVVTSKDPTVSGKEIADKVMSQVAPALGVRVHEVRELKRGDAVIRTPSRNEINKVVANAKFNEVGLEVE
ncbi:hypothetical protein KR215_003208, partial [Drosophila sulfurigaster]